MNNQKKRDGRKNPKYFVTNLFVLIGFLFIGAVHVNAAEQTLTKDTVIDEKYVVETDLTISGEHTLTLNQGMEVTGDLTIKGATVIVKDPVMEERLMQVAVSQ